MSGARYTLNLGNDSSGRPIFLIGEGGRWKLRRVDAVPTQIELSVEQIRMIAREVGA